MAAIQPLAMTPPGTGAATLQHETTGRTDPDAVDAALAASGDAHAFERLYRGHLARIASLARRMLGDDDADDVIQDVFVRAWQKLGTFRGEAAFGTWLHRLAVNVILGRRETLGIRRQRHLDGDAMLELGAQPPADAGDLHGLRDGDPAAAGGRATGVRAARRGRATGTRRSAQMLGLATGTSKSQLHRARMALRQHLER